MNSVEQIGFTSTVVADKAIDAGAEAQVGFVVVFEKQQVELVERHQEWQKRVQNRIT
jgi:hypothetical protein